MMRISDSWLMDIVMLWGYPVFGPFLEMFLLWCERKMEDY